MLRALVWKEWRQLRTLRGVGVGLGLLLPLVALSAPGAARQGWIPMAELARGYNKVEILMEAMPLALALGLWPLVALLMTAQSFAGDRSEGTESFLLERPVARSRVWAARVLASFGSTLLVVACTAAIWLVLTLSSVGPSARAWPEALQRMGIGGPLATLACFLAGMIAASLLRAPLAALLLGLVLVAVPVQISTSLGAWTTFARIGDLSVGLIVPALLLLVYPVGSFAAMCRGEPAGRGRLRRALAALAAGFAVMIVVFVISSVAAVRVLARQLDQGADVVASPATESAFAESTGGWILDLATAERLRFFPPPIWRTAWRADGKRLAVCTASGPFGSIKASQRVEFFDPRGRPVGKTLRLDEQRWAWRMRWAGDRLVLIEPNLTEGSRVHVYDPETGTSRYGDAPVDWYNELVGPTRDGQIFLAFAEKPSVAAGQESESDDEDDPRPRNERYGLFPIDLESGEIGAEPLIEDVGHRWNARRALSPSGRYWIRDRRGRRTETARVVDLETGAELPMDGLGREARWAGDDLLVWIRREEGERHIVMARPGEPADILRSWTDLHVSLEVSPDRNRLLVNVARVLEEKPTGFFEPVITRQGDVATWVYELSTRRWIELAAWPSREFEGYAFRTIWAGPATVARTGPGVLALERLDRPGEIHSVIGPAIP